MSLNSLASSRVSKQLTALRPALQPASDDVTPSTGQDVQNAVSALVEYLPSETISLYLAVVAALPTLKQVIPALTPAIVYWVFAVLTPVLFALIYAGKRRAAGQSRWPGRVQDFPWWPCGAATIAFLAWALTVPDRPFLPGDAGGVVAGLIAIVVSALLGVVGRYIGS